MHKKIPVLTLLAFCIQNLINLTHIDIQLQGVERVSVVYHTESLK